MAMAASSAATPAVSAEEVQVLAAQSQGGGTAAKVVWADFENVKAQAEQALNHKNP